jgi:iron-sulfur cluster assembly protein
VLTLTPDATQAPSQAGLRVQLTEDPDETDQVIEEAGARVFVEETVVDYLDDKELDADVVDERTRFALRERT